ncbi:hypothetical protein ACVITL_005804 [Rhizobium pisi]
MTTIMVLRYDPARQNLGNARAKTIVEGVFSQIAEVAMGGAASKSKERTIMLDNS